VELSSSPELPRIEWRTGEDFELGGLEYSCRPIAGHFPSTAEHLCIRKPRAAVEHYAALIGELEPRAIFELGIFEGGSTALLAQLARPEKLIAVDLKDEAAAGLEGFIEAQGLSDSVAVHWGVDQSDGAHLVRLLDELGERELDLVIDDASHQLEPTRSSFDTLFPRLRPGGLFVLEDWSWAHAPLPVWPHRRPLTVLVFELVMACAYAEDLIARIEIDRSWVTIHRGPRELDPNEFRLQKLIGERGRKLISTPKDSPPPPHTAGGLRRLLRRS
jgi:predicted O-methyltransferase YrrM